MKSRSIMGVVELYVIVSSVLHMLCTDILDLRLTQHFNLFLTNLLLSY